MDKLDMLSNNTKENKISIIKNFFPNCIIEENNHEVIDFDKLKSELINDIFNGKEKYELTWPGKKEARVSVSEHIRKTLRPIKEKSINFDNTENIYIEGDNLEVLKILQESYLNKIKCIYIDPPYNTGNDFVYNDNFDKSIAEENYDNGNIDEYGNRLISNPSSNGRFHSDWLSMMYSRIKLARNLLKQDGMMFISIDSNEYDNLKKICDEIFGENSLISDFIVIRSEGGGLAKFVVKGHDYLLAYAKDINHVSPIAREKDIRGKIIEKNGSPPTL